MRKTNQTVNKTSVDINMYIKIKLQIRPYAANVGRRLDGNRE